MITEPSGERYTSWLAISSLPTTSFRPFKELDFGFLMKSPTFVDQITSELQTRYLVDPEELNNYIRVHNNMYRNIQGGLINKYPVHISNHIFS